MVPETIRDRSGGGRVDRLVAQRGGIVSDQMPVLNDEKPAIATAVHVFVDEALDAGGAGGSAEPRAGGKWVSVEVLVVRHLHVTVDAVKLQGRSRRGPQRHRWQCSRAKKTHQTSGVGT